MARKVFISFLGYSNYGSCCYFKDGFTSENTRYIQVATLEYLQSIEKWTENDVAYILLTKGAKDKNWENDGHLDFQTHKIIIQPGLRDCLAAKNFPFCIKTVEGLPDGNNEEEIFAIFDRVFEVLEPEDELFFDVTHGFRYLPMLVLVLANYSKFLKNIKVKAITYGNYEARTKTEETDGLKPIFRAPVVDLLPLSLIQNWTYAAADYLRNGKSDRFVELAVDYRSSIFQGVRDGDKANAKLIESIAKNLKLTTEDFQTCRGPEILDGKHVTKLKNDLSNLNDTSIKPLIPLAKELVNAFKPFNSKDEESEKLQFKNGIEAAKWCFNNKLYQQAAVILQENIVSFFCHQYHLDIVNVEERKLVNMAFIFAASLNSKSTTEEQKNEINRTIDNTPVLQTLMSDPLIIDKTLYDAFGILTTERNDINHNGMRKGPHSVKKISENIKKAIDIFSEQFANVWE